MKSKRRSYSKVFFYSLVACLIIFGSSRSFGYEWSKTFGGTNYERGMSVGLTTDGGYIIVGYAGTDPSWDSPGDIYLIKTDIEGNELWSKTFGGSGSEDGISVRQTTDNGYIIIGNTTSGGGGAYLIKTDTNGNELWNKIFVGSWSGAANSVEQTTDGGYIFVGTTDSDVYLVKTDADGNELWSKTFGGNEGEDGESVRQTIDGGYIIAYNNDSGDLYLIKTDRDGNELWSNKVGQGVFRWVNWVQQTNDDGYIVSGGEYDFNLIKTDGDGNVLWNKTFGGSGWELGQEAQQTSDGGYIMVGRTTSFGAGSEDCYLVKTDADGNELWSKTFGGSEIDWGRSVKQTADGGYIIGGRTSSFGAGASDVYLVYYKPEDNVNNHVTFEPDPSTYEFDPDTTDCQTGAVGKFSFDATLTNISVKELSNLYVEVDELTNNNLLLTTKGLIGEGERFEVPEIDDYADGILSAEEYADVPFTVCLQEKSPFRFFVNVLGIAKEIPKIPDPVSYWKLDEGAGNIAYDSVGNNNGTIYGADWTNGRDGKSLNFDGVDDYVEVPGPLSFSELTFSVWLKIPDVGINNNRIFTIDEGGGHYYALQGNSANALSLVIDGEEVNEYDWSFLTNTWTHIAMTYDGHTIKVYKNGVMTESGVIDGDPISGPLFIGGVPDPEYGAQIWDGAIDEVAIFDKILSDSEILQLSKGYFDF